MVAARRRHQGIESPLRCERIGDPPGPAAAGIRRRLRLLLLLLLGDSALFLLFLLGLLLLLLLHRLLLGGLLLLLDLLLSLRGGLLAAVVVIAAATDQRQTGGADPGPRRGSQERPPRHPVAPYSLPVVSFAHRAAPIPHRPVFPYVPELDQSGDVTHTYPPPPPPPPPRAICQVARPEAVLPAPTDTVPARDRISVGTPLMTNSPHVGGTSSIAS